MAAIGKLSLAQIERARELLQNWPELDNWKTREEAAGILERDFRKALKRGYTIGSGQTHAPALLLKMSVGIILGALCFCCGIFWGALAARNFAEGNAIWRKFLLAALGCMAPGGWIFSFTLF